MVGLDSGEQSVWRVLTDNACVSRVGQMACCLAAELQHDLPVQVKHGTVHRTSYTAVEALSLCPNCTGNLQAFPMNVLLCVFPQLPP